MEKKRVSSVINPKILFHDQEIDLICNKISKFLDTKELSSIIPDCKLLKRSLLFITNPQVASKSFAILIGLAANFHSKQDSANACKYLNGAEQILHLVDQQELLSEFEKIKSSVKRKAGNKELWKLRLEGMDNKSFEQKWHGVQRTERKGKNKDYLALDLNRPATSVRKYTGSQGSPGSFESRFGINTTRPNSAKRIINKKIWKDDSLDLTKSKISSFQLTRKESYLINRKKYKPENFSQRVDVLTPPKTPEGLLKLCILKDSKPESVIQKKQVRPKSSRAKTFNQTANHSSTHKKFKLTLNNPLLIQESKTIKMPETTREKNATIISNQFKDINKLNTQNLSLKRINTKRNLPKAPDIDEESKEVKVKIKKCKIVYKEITKIFISNLVKLQAWIRGNLARERFA